MNFVGSKVQLQTGLFNPLLAHSAFLIAEVRGLWILRGKIHSKTLAIWAFQIILCNVWMRYFYYDPCEWVWRSLTYWRFQPFKKKQAALQPASRL